MPTAHALKWLRPASLLAVCGCAPAPSGPGEVGGRLSARFDAAGAHLSTSAATVTVETVEVGGPPALSPWSWPGTRVERPRGAIVEWWERGPLGLEQGWTVPAPVGGASAFLRVPLRVTGARATIDRATVRLEPPRGDAVLVTALYAVDATGAALPSWFEPTGGGFRVVVDVGGARYPVEIDPLYTTGTTLEGAHKNEGFGVSVAGVGDLNADGYADVVVGAHDYSAATGRADLFLGSRDGVSSAAAQSLQGDHIGAWFGHAVAAAGDVNGDGFADVIIGASDRGESDGAGQATVYFGSSSGLDPAGATRTGDAAEDLFGERVAGAGDVDGDGYDDVLVGAWAAERRTGAVFLYCGSPDGLDEAPSWTLRGEAEGDALGMALAGAGDVDGDGFDDVVVGASERNTAWLFRGSRHGLLSTADTTITIEPYGYGFGSSVASAGDVDDDGYDDVLVMSSVYVRLFRGSARGLEGGEALSIAAELGAASGLGDIDGDGDDDVIVGMSGSDAAALHLGSRTGLTRDPVQTVRGEMPDQRFGYSVAGAGDVNGDGAADVIIGAPATDDGAGRAYVYLGYDATDADHDGYVVTSDCDDSRASVHPGAEEVCDDVDRDDDCDGVADGADATGKETFFSDGDGDGFGDSAAAVDACDPAPGLVADGSDCDDRFREIHPGAPETCNGIDDDCDGAVDGDDATNPGAWYEDADGDGAPGAVNTVVRACRPPEGYVATADRDCDEGDPARHPGALEIAGDGVDQDCDGADAAIRSCGCAATGVVPSAWLAALGWLLVRRRPTRPMP